MRFLSVPAVIISIGLWWEGGWVLVDDFDYFRARPWFEISCFNELAGSGVYRSEIGDVDAATCYDRDSGDLDDELGVMEPATNIFDRSSLEIELIEWIAGRAFSHIRSDIFVWPGAIDPLVNCFMDFLASHELEKEYEGLSTVLSFEDGEALLDHQATNGFAATLTWRFVRDAHLQDDDLHRMWHILQGAFPNLPVEL
jgi:hypothetical protein